MLKQLSIKNVILIDHLDVSFEKGFNVLTGETGAGKSAIMQAIKLVLGNRADSSILRRGESRGSVMAAFDIENYQELLALLEESGIEHHCQDLLLIQRELNSNGKHRSFINNQLVQVSLVEKVGLLLVDIAAQHAYQRLFSLDAHLNILDAYCKLSPSLLHFQNAWRSEIQTRKQLETLVSKKHTSKERRDRLQAELEEISQANLILGEEESLFEEYTHLLNLNEKCSKARELVDIFEGRSSPLPILNKQSHLLEDLTALDQTLLPSLKSFEAVQAELNEISYSLTRYLDSLEYNPGQEEVINNRLTTIAKIKKKYGPTLDDVITHHKNIQEEIEEIEHLEEKIDSLEKLLVTLKEASDKEAKTITELRKAQAKKLEKAVEKEIQSLNMPKACFQIEVTAKQRSATGDEKVEFKFAPNFGENTLSLKESASGGELSRVLLALKSVLLEEDKVPTLIFDEIDANIGGETATIVGEKLASIGKKHQVLCITHLPQVAHLADHHYQISKLEKNERTLTSIMFLDKKSRQKELARMLGGKNFSEKVLNN